MPDEPQRPPEIEPMDPPASNSAVKKGGALAAAIAVILGAVYVNEGGYVNDARDPGGATNYGVTEKVARAAGYTGDMRNFPKHCPGPATVCADGIYVEKYIVAPGYMPIVELEPAVGGELVDSAVNFGPARPSRWFQQSLNELTGAGLVVDGKIGRRTVLAYVNLEAAKGDGPACVAMLDKLDAKQAAEYRRLAQVNPKLKVFLKGWLRNRVGNIDRKSCRMPE